jgi:hypothetical protein
MPPKLGHSAWWSQKAGVLLVTEAVGRRAHAGYGAIMRNPSAQLSKVRRAAVAGLLVAVPLMPLAACGDDGRDDGDSEIQTEQEGGGDGDGLY